MKKGIVLSVLLLLASAACATHVGVVVEFPNGALYTECVSVERASDAYEILQGTGLAPTWIQHPIYGHGLCSLLDVGCQEGCACKSEYWNFYTKRKGGEWQYSAVGFDGGSSCREHYCAREGDMLGFTFNSDGKRPRKISFEEVCPPAEESFEEPDIIGRAIAYPQKNAGLISAVLLILLLVGYFVHKPWEYI